MESLNRISLVAPCGMNCGICMAYVRKKNRCLGCGAADTNKAVSVLRCKIKNCEVFQKGRVKFCFECDNFPCKNLRHLDKRYRTKYSMSMIENLENIRDYGIRSFLKNEDIRWACSKCGGTICVHDRFCVECGKKK